MKKGFTLIMSAIMLFPASLWGLSWYLSARTQANEYCMGEFSIFHSDFICREPHIALYISTGVCIISILVMHSGVKSVREKLASQ